MLRVAVRVVDEGGEGGGRGGQLSAKHDQQVALYHVGLGEREGGGLGCEIVCLKMCIRNSIYIIQYFNSLSLLPALNSPPP